MDATQQFESDSESFVVITENMPGFPASPRVSLLFDEYPILSGPTEPLLLAAFRCKFFATAPQANEP